MHDHLLLASEVFEEEKSWRTLLRISTVMMNSLPKSLSMLQGGSSRILAAAVRRSSSVPVTSVMVKELRERSGIDL